ncbi:HET-domain containing protein [Fusarium agapanthi]|uniref:HET-domain containing protein n=1 Tax=Fusarium agapanthi TaxID=1803897 RepID=A0A9P5E4C4_9HYPO|nr:HET-domain containing protein [Fusarium agapanthi]
MTSSKAETPATQAMFPKGPPAGVSEMLENDILFILKRAQKVFAIWILAGIKGRQLLEVMELFQSKKASDSGLPFTEDNISGFTRFPESMARVESLGCEGDFCDSNEIANFLEKQWWFCAPVFNSEQVNHDVNLSAILPFTEAHSDTADEGAFGQVLKYTIHESHINTEGLMPQPKFVAVKTIKLEAQDQPSINRLGWEKEVRALWNMREFDQRHIVKFITAFRREDEHYLILEWADGGNLRNLWDRMKHRLTANLVKDAFEQLLGLSEALGQVHNPKKESSNIHFRHGDLKPENILWFKDSTDPGKIGTLKIADWGLAKQHQDLTQVRTKQTTTSFGTRLYEPPEEKRSRLYDVWAMGCIWLEFLIWLMYGRHGLTKFKQGFYQVRRDFVRFYEIDDKEVAKVHKVVKKWMDHMAKDPVCDIGATALGDLLELIRDRLLVVELPDGYGSTNNFSTQPGLSGRPSTITQHMQGLSVSEGHQTSGSIPSITVIDSESQDSFVPKPLPSTRGRRARSCDLFDHMSTINEDHTEGYWLSGTPLPPPDDATKYTGHLREQSVEQPASGLEGGLSVTQTHTLALTERLEEDWKRIIDNDMGNAILSSLKSRGLLDTSIPESSKLCISCQTFRNDVWTPTFTIYYTWDQLERNSNSNACDLCTALWKLTQKVGNKSPHIQFIREQSTILLNSHTTVATLLRSPDLRTGIDKQVQVGLPTMSPAGSTAYLEIIRQWLLACDYSHSMCRRGSNTFSSSGTSKRSPTRVIAVGKDGDEKVHLVETDSSNEGDWVALSHQWGTGTQFRTLTTNIGAHRVGIGMDELPATFRDSVIVTRALGRPYLWIDSICIIQGPDGDFGQEAKRMEQVYSGAYCVLAASRSPGHSAGFLGPRKEALSVTLSREGSEPFYLCEIIDDFQSHVLEGSLNERGWVLQEHALARRTIYFTEYQTYFECGEGVYCESMCKIQRSTFLGDPNFPRLMMQADKGAKILGYQDLYKLYSGLALTRPSDRPWAINGLQERIVSALKIQGQFGVFFEDRPGGRRRGLLRRSLLWRRSESVASLDRISFVSGPSALMVPSWSWMAYSGRIDYISAEFGGTEWEPLQSQWESGDKKN